MKTACPHCGRHYEVEDQYRDQTHPCPACGKDFTIKDYISEEKKPKKTTPPAEEQKPEKNYAGTEFLMRLYGFFIIAIGFVVYVLGLISQKKFVAYSGMGLIFSSIFGFTFAGILFYLRKIEENTRKK